MAASAAFSSATVPPSGTWMIHWPSPCVRTRLMTSCLVGLGTDAACFMVPASCRSCCRNVFVPGRPGSWL